MSEINNDIISLANQGNEEAWKKLLIQYSKLIWSASRKYGFSESDREDIVQEVFIRLIKCIGSYDPQISRFSTFLAVISERTCIDKLRKETNRHEELFSDPELVENFSYTFNQDETIHSEKMISFLKNAINELPADKKLVIELFYFKGYSYDQIAEAMNRDVRWVGNSLDRTRKKLKKIINQASLRRNLRNYGK